MGAQARLDMRDRRGAGEAGQGRTQRAGRVALNDQKVRSPPQPQQHRLTDGGDVRVGVFLSRAIQPVGGKDVQPVVARIERGMLSGEDDRRHDTLRGKCASDGCQLDRFRSGPDDQPDILRAQPSP